MTSRFILRVTIMQLQLDDILHYYEQTRTDYRILWQDSAQAIHIGYWTDQTRSHNDSLLEMNRQLAQRIGIHAADHVLDAGCGIGGSSRWLAQTYGCRVTGINIVGFQLDLAREAARRQNLTRLVNFERQDYGHMTFDGETFSAAWFLESLVHASDKGQVLAEAGRVLKPGGRIVIADYTIPEDLSPEGQRRLQPWCDGWAMPPFDKLSSYRKFLTDAGFTDITIQNVDWHVAPSLRRLWRLSKLARPGAKALSTLRVFPDYRYRNVHASVVQYETFVDRLWEYSLITATKPAEPKACQWDSPTS
jgi:ubiquinone/menaquinone biosynthesis C-methylase UbiE